MSRPLDVELAPAKLNLALHVRGKRTDGYHDLETLFAFVRDGDVLSVASADGLLLSIDGSMAAGLSDTGDNLVLRAARLLAGKAGVKPKAHLRLTKNLPVASGIGGGSADAAAAFRLLNRYWSIGWPLEKLAALAGQLGADVPACVYSRPLLGSGRGESLSPVALPELADTAVLLVNPMVAVPTGPVFAAWDGVDRGSLGGDLSLAGLRHARNDLQPGAARLFPVITEVLELLSGCEGVRLVRMSGSGATCFALFESKQTQAAGTMQLKRLRPEWWFLDTVLNHNRKPDSLPVS